MFTCRFGPNFSIKDIAYAIAASGVPFATAHARVKIYAKHRLIHVREKGINTQPNGYDFSDAAAACALSALQEAGIQDHEVLRAASQALYTWRDPLGLDVRFRLIGQPDLLRHPIDRAFVGNMRLGEDWNLYVSSHRNREGLRVVFSDLSTTKRFGADTVSLVVPMRFFMSSVHLAILEKNHLATVEEVVTQRHASL